MNAVADANQALEETGKEWGNLRPRDRKSLLQGRDDPYSPVYRKITEMFYRRVTAESP